MSLKVLRCGSERCASFILLSGRRRSTKGRGEGHGREANQLNRIAILSNAGSGRNARKAALIESFGGLTAVHQEVTRSAADLPRALEALLARNPSVLAINGGDGYRARRAHGARGSPRAAPLAACPRAVPT